MTRRDCDPTIVTPETLPNSPNGRGLAMVSPSSYKDYRDILREELAVRSQINPRYSLRAFARDMELAPSRLSEVLSGKQGLSRPVASRIADKLGYSETERDFFCDLVESIHARKEQSRSEAMEKIKRAFDENELLRLKNDTFHLISDWFHLAMLELTTLDGFQSDVKWIAKVLGISENEVELGLERLERFGFISRDDGQIVTVEQRTTTPGGTPSESIKKFHKQILQKAMDSIYLQPIDSRDLSAIILAVDRSRLGEAKERIKQFRREFCTELNSSTVKDGVYCLSIQFFSLTETWNHD